MFEVSVESEFIASHAIVVHGSRETSHEHNWKVTVTVAGHELDADGLLVDFEHLKRILEELIGPWRSANLNTTPPFDQTNPTAERVAEFIATSLRADLPAHVQLKSVAVTEAPGCVAVYRPRHDAPGE